MGNLQIIWCILYMTYPCFIQGGPHDLHFSPQGTSKEQCNLKTEKERFDCHPDPKVTKESCESRGCCWISPSDSDSKVPSCYFPTDYPTYKPDGAPVTTPTGLALNISRDQSSPWPNDINKLRVDVFYETDTRLHFKIYDPSNKRYEVPIETPAKNEMARQYDVHISESSNKFSLTVNRKSNGAVLFDSNIESAPLIFADQFIQISTLVPSGMFYGLGEHRAPLYHNLSQWQRLTYWTSGKHTVENTNLYGVHPFFMSFDKDNNAYGVFFLNSNAMETDLQPAPSITYRTIGGIIDFYVFLGPSPDNVVEQYTEVIGKPHMPPYWGLGFHLCRFGYNTIENLTTVINRTRAGGFPYESQWTDIDTMSKHLDWTYAHDNFSGLPELVDNLHKEGQRYVMILDPGISNEQPAGQYPPYDEGLKMGVFVKSENGELIVGKVWPGTTVYVDFTNEKAPDYWYQMAKMFHQVIPFDSIWNDMNDPSNQLDGNLSGCGKGPLDNPPYTPNITNNGGRPTNLIANSICPSAVQSLSSHYNVHSLYAHYEAIATRYALEKVRGKRSFVITRSSFAGTGKYAGHWTGDNYATWHDLQQSIPQTLNFQMFGIPMVGPDICGHVNDTTDELCTRWMQTGSFYPFMRNHNRINDRDQDPGSFSKSVQDAMKPAMFLRYKLLPYLYTLFFHSHIYGTTVARPLSFNFPEDREARVIDRQFMWGSHLLISPVIDQGQRSVYAYFPSGDWYNFTTGALIQSTGQYKTLSAELNIINVHQRAGSVIPTQRAAITTTASRQLPFSLQVALDKTGNASGSLYWDDGDSLDTAEMHTYNYISFTVENNELRCIPVFSGYKIGMDLESVRILGLKMKPKEVYLNDTPTSFQYDSTTKILDVFNFDANLVQRFSIRWTF